MNLFGVLVTLFLFSKALLQDYPVWVTCAPEYFQVIMERDLFRNGIHLNPNQVILGQGCGVSSVLEDKFFFFYTIFQCGIRKEVKWNMVVLQSFLYCHSLINVEGGTRSIPLQCTFPYETLHHPVTVNFPPSSVGMAEMNDARRTPSVSLAQQDVRSMGWGSGHQDLGAAALAWNTFPNLTLSLASFTCVLGA